MVGECSDCGCSLEHHKGTLDGWACVNCQQYCTAVDTGLHDNAINEWADELFGEATPQ